MKQVRIFSLLIVLFFLSACSVDEPILGSISFTASHDCDIRLFDSAVRQIAHQQYEIEKSAVIVSMKRSGVYVVHAVSDAKTIKESLTFVNGNIDYYIEF